MVGITQQRKIIYLSAGEQREWKEDNGSLVPVMANLGCQLVWIWNSLQGKPPGSLRDVLDQIIRSVCHLLVAAQINGKRSFVFACFRSYRQHQVYLVYSCCWISSSVSASNTGLPTCTEDQCLFMNPQYHTGTAEPPSTTDWATVRFSVFLVYPERLLGYPDYVVCARLTDPFTIYSFSWLCSLRIPSKTTPSRLFPNNPKSSIRLHLLKILTLLDSIKPGQAF